MTEQDSETEYPDEFDAEPPDPVWQDATESFVVKVRRYDKNDVLMGTQYFVVAEDTEQGSYMISSIMKDPEPEADYS